MKKQPRGASVLVLMLFLPIVLGLLGLCVDWAALLAADVKLDTAVDAGALAAAASLVLNNCINSDTTQDLTPDCEAKASAAATALALENVPDALVNLSFDTVNAADATVTVTASETVPTIFAKLFGINSVNLNAVAHGEAFWSADASTATARLIRRN
jgi:Putative Tad-like Flp pilus-assembly